MELTAKTLAGLENVLADELIQLGAQDVTPLKRAVSFRGDQTLLYRANLELATALRILTPIHHFRAKHENILYKEVLKFKWSDYLSLADTFAIDSTVNSPYFTHSKYLALKTKDAIADHFRNAYGRRPDVDVQSPTLRIHLHVSNDECTLLLDSSGEALYKRGHQRQALQAPINEVLAAGIIRLSGWERDCDFIDPMCGSGTIPIEAAFFAYNIPPLINRLKFGFMKWKDFDSRLWRQVVSDAKKRLQPFDHKILAFDQDDKAVWVSRENILHAGLENYITVEQKAFEDTTASADRGVLVMNPPYDERLAATNIEALYHDIGDHLKQHYQGYEAWIISANQAALKSVGLRPSKKLTLYNGQLECKLMKYELYQGSRKGSPGSLPGEQESVERSE